MRQALAEVKQEREKESSCRFIPLRKESKYGVMLSSAHEVASNQSLKGEFARVGNRYSVCELYKSVVLNIQQEQSCLRFHNGCSKGQGISVKSLGGSRLCLGVDKENQEVVKTMPTFNAKSKAKYQQYKVLDAPGLADDFYLNLVDWSANNMLAVGLGSQLYIWNGNSNKVSSLCDLSKQLNSLSEENAENNVQSVQWNKQGSILSIGDCRGGVHIYDVIAMKRITTYKIHEDRIGSISWRDDSCFTSGSRDKQIISTDIRTQKISQKYLNGHFQEVCGLKWAFDGQTLASGGNDNRLLTWSLKSANQPVYKFTAHKAGVKAVSWSPHQHGLLVSGGGTADRTIRFWDTNQGKLIDYIDAHSQVCNIVFSKNSNEFVSTHGFQDNHIIVWKYPTLEKQACLIGHSCRVLQLSLSPCSTKIVTGAGDETLRFWDVFQEKKEEKNVQSKLEGKFDDLR